MEEQNRPKFEEHSMPHIVIGPRLRPINKQFIDAFKLIYRHWAPLLIVQAIIFFATIALVIFAICIFLTPIFVGLMQGLDVEEMLKYVFSGYFWIGLAVVFVPMAILGSWGSAAMIAALGYKEKGMAPIGYTLKKGVQLLLPFLILLFWVTLAYVGGAVLLIFPAVIICIGLSLSWYVIVLEDVSVFQAISTSWNITKGYKWSILGRFLLLVIIVWGIMIGLAMSSMVPIMGLMSIPIQFVLNFIVTPYALAYFYLIYDDIRSVRQDVYPMRGGISALMIIFWIVGVVFCSGVVLGTIYLIQRYLV